MITEVTAALMVHEPGITMNIPKYRYYAHGLCFGLFRCGTVPHLTYIIQGCSTGTGELIPIVVLLWLGN